MTYLTPREVSIRIGLKYSTVLEWAKAGILPARIIQHRKKSKYFFVEKEVVATIEKHKVSRI